MRINHNLSAMNTHRQLSINDTNSSKSMEKLSSGYRINRAADDAAGLSISEKMRAQIKSLTQGSRNTQDGISLAQTAEGALTEVSDMLTRAKELAVQASSGTYNTTDLAAIDAEYTELKSAIDDIATKTDFNGIKMLNAATSIDIQFGANSGDKITITGGDMQSSAIGLTGDMTSNANAKTELGAIDSAIEAVNTLRSSFGALQNHMEHTQKNLDATSENLQAAESRIRDVDMAKEMSEYTKNNILSQAATSMLAQANQQPQNVLSLLR
ncbi:MULTISPECIES: flagellin [Brevibacillus]|uniref:flagellin N-terminal helical domain-containing protein n=1 Tax=Brevibacillus TaxID=55080 RepID=UPI000F0A03C5|nr:MULTISPECIES: flagellin [Brevibacillus]MDR7317979.1 flagellin [Brevibacillus nitrificans]MEC2130560.1 flagellin [Brevibacillus centrosporus]RNB68838.1 flagellin [Brevibacillus centrosporus]GED33876.1 flagellin [Brevibacillus centrosporus]